MQVFLLFQGAIHFSATQNLIDGQFVPRLSPVLIEFTLQKPGVVVSREVDRILGSMFRLPHMNWEMFEMFFAYFEALRSNLFQLLETNSVSLRKLYPGAKVAHKLLLKQRFSVQGRGVVRLHNHLKPSTSTLKQYHGDVVLPGLNNPGFDIGMAYGEKDWMLIETRYSSDKGSVTVDDVRHKVALIQKQQQSLPGWISFFNFCAGRVCLIKLYFPLFTSQRTNALTGFW